MHFSSWKYTEDLGARYYLTCRGLSNQRGCGGAARKGRSGPVRSRAANIILNFGRRCPFFHNRGRHGRLLSAPTAGLGATISLLERQPRAWRRGWLNAGGLAIMRRLQGGSCSHHGLCSPGGRAKILMIEEKDSGLRVRHWPLLLIITGFVLLAGLYGLLIPPFEGPDEAQHFAYIEWLVREGSFPPQGDAAWDTPVEQEGGQPPLYYLLASLPARLVDLDAPRAVYNPNPHFPAPLPRSRIDNDNRAINAPGLPELRGGWLALYAARFLTLSFGVLLIVAVYGLARQLVPDSTAVAYGAAFLVAFTPQVIYLSSMASNDIPAAALATTALWLYATFLRRDGAGPAWLPLAAGAVLGLAGLTKVSALLLTVPFALGLAWLWLSGRRSFGEVLRAGLFLGGGLLLVAGWWFARSWLLYGSPTGIESHDLTPWAITDPSLLPPAWARWLEVFRSYWLALGWGTIRPAPWVYNVLGALSLAGLAGFVVAVWRWRSDPQRSQTTAVLFGLLFIGLLLMAVFLETWMRRVTAPYGRLLFPMLAALVIPLVIGWRAIHPRFAWLASGFVFAWALLTPVVLIRAAYTPQLLSPAGEAALPPAVGWRFLQEDRQPLAELISVEPLLTSTGVRTTLPVRSCWRALAEPEEEYTLLIQLIGPDDSVVANRYTYPGQGLYPTSVWQAGTVFCQVDHVWLDRSIPVTLVYQLSLGFVNDATGKRLATVYASGDPVKATFVGDVRVEAWEAVERAGELGTGTAVQLVDYEIDSQEAVVDLTLKWAAAEPLPGDYQVFVHLRDAASGTILAQADGPPLGGWYPTNRWTVGEIVTDTRRLVLPVDMPPGAYTLVVGMYDLVTGQRVGDEYTLPGLEVSAAS